MPSAAPIVYTSTARKGWDAFDRMVLGAVSHETVATFNDVVCALPAGLDLRLIRESLAWLDGQGLISQTTAIVNGTITRTFTMHHSHRKAA